MSKRTQNILTAIIKWRERHISEKRFVLVLSFFTGVGCALAAFILKGIIHLIQTLVLTISNTHNWLYFILPTVGIAITAVFIKFVIKDNISHGVTRILYAISQHKSIIKLHNIYSSIISSSITIGFGGSVGAEAPIVLTGSAIGSNLGRLFKLDQKTLMMLVGCGAAGAIGGIFKAPIAGVAFVLEVLMMDLTMTSIAPLLIASVTATAFSHLMMGNAVMFVFNDYAPFSLGRIPYIVLLGIVCGLISLYFTRGMNFLEQRFKKIKRWYLKILVGGISLGVLIFIFPPLYGEGYDSISSLLSANSDSLFAHSLFDNYHGENWMIILYLGLIIFFKIFATAATNGGGGCGGIFAPSLFVGCIAGFVVAEILNIFGFAIPNQNFALAGMAGLMSGVMHAPLTGTFLIAELTGGYDLFMTLIITSVVSYLTIIIFEPHSLYAMRLAQTGELLTHHKDRVVLTLMKMENVIETDLSIVTPDMTLGELVKVISQSNRNLYPVVDENKHLLGVVSLDEVRNIMFRPELYKRFSVRQLMILPPGKVIIDMPMESVMDLFEKTGAWNLPVVNKEGEYIGFVSKSKIFNSYRKVLVHFSED